MAQIGERKIEEGIEYLYTPAQGGWIKVGEPTGEPITQLDETTAPETEETAQDLQEDASELKEGGEPRPDTTNLINKTAGISDMLQMYAKQQESFLEQHQEAQKSFLDKVKSTFTPSKTYQESLEQAKVPETMEKLTESVAAAKEIRENIINLETQRDAALATEEQKPVSMATLTRRQQRIEEDFNRRIATASKRLAAESAYQQALQGNIQMAQSMAQQEVQYAIWEEDRRYTMLKDTYDMNQDLIKTMGQEYDKIFQLAINEAENRRDEAKASKSRIAEMETTATQYGLKLDLIDMEEDEARKVFNEAIAPLAQEERALDIAAKRKQLEGVEPGVDAVKGWVDLINAGRADITNVPSDIRNQVVNELAGEIPDPTNEEWVKEAVEGAKADDISNEDIRKVLKELGTPENLIDKYAPEEITPPVSTIEAGERVGEGFSKIEPGKWVAGAIKAVPKFTAGVLRGIFK